MRFLRVLVLAAVVPIGSGCTTAGGWFTQDAAPLDQWRPAPSGPLVDLPMPSLSDSLLSEPMYLWGK